MSFAKYLSALSLSALLVVSVVLQLTARAADNEPAPLLKNGDRVAFVGAGFVERMQQHDWLEAMLTVALPEAKFRNVGWSGDTVFGDARAVFGSRDDGFARLLRDIDQANPTVAVLCYGENECWDGEKGLAAFTANYQKLIDHLRSKESRVIVMLPRHRESTKSIPGVPSERYNAQLKQYNESIRKLCSSQKIPAVDLESFAKDETLTTDGVYWSEDGYYRVAIEICKQLQLPQSQPAIDVNWSNNSVTMNGQSAKLNVKRSTDKATIEVHFDSLPVASRGKINVTSKSQKSVQAIPTLGSQIEDLRLRINQKNAWFFHRYRPQNETYLFLFRKHEQGNNAAELEQIEPQISTYESQIAKAAVSTPFAIEFVNPK